MDDVFEIVVKTKYFLNLIFLFKNKIKKIIIIVTKLENILIRMLQPAL